MPIIDDRISWCQVEPEIKQLFLLASENWADPKSAEKYINMALSVSQNNLDVLVGAYRFFFYQHQPETALTVAQKILDLICVKEKLPKDWVSLKPLLINRSQDPHIRLYLNAYAAQSLILAQLGRIEEAKLIAQRVKEMDLRREFCATTVFEVITKSPDDDEYDD